MIVPTVDTDLMWHTHRLDVTAYRKDMHSVLGFVMSHNVADARTVEGKERNTKYFH